MINSRRENSPKKDLRVMNLYALCSTGSNHTNQNGILWKKSTNLQFNRNFNTILSKINFNKHLSDLNTKLTNLIVDR